MDLNHSEHVFDRLVFKCPVDNTAAILGQRERDSVNIAQAGEEFSLPYLL